MKVSELSATDIHSMRGRGMLAYSRALVLAPWAVVRLTAITLTATSVDVDSGDPEDSSRKRSSTWSGPLAS